MGWRGTLRTMGAIARKVERERQREERNAQKQAEIDFAFGQVDRFESAVEKLRTVHCKISSEFWDWDERARTKPPLQPEYDGSEYEAACERLETFEPSFFVRLFGLIERKRAALAIAVESAKEMCQNRFEAAEQCYKDDLAVWQKEHDLATRIQAGDVSAYRALIDHKSPLSAIYGVTASNVSFDSRTWAKAEVLAAGIEILPNVVCSQTSTGRLVSKPMPKSQGFEIHQDYICSVALRVAQELYHLLPLEEVLVNVSVVMLDTRTGHLQELLVLSVLIPGQTLYTINAAFLDPSNSMQNFNHNMDFKKTRGLMPVASL